VVRLTKAATYREGKGKGKVTILVSNKILVWPWWVLRLKGDNNHRTPIYHDDGEYRSVISRAGLKPFMA
jgi:hypothetical protein